jgi:hypothetical protein
MVVTVSDPWPASTPAPAWTATLPFTRAIETLDSYRSASLLNSQQTNFTRNKKTPHPTRKILGPMPLEVSMPAYAGEKLAPMRHMVRLNNRFTVAHRHQLNDCRRHGATVISASRCGVSLSDPGGAGPCNGVTEADCGCRSAACAEYDHGAERRNGFEGFAATRRRERSATGAARRPHDDGLL